MEPNNGLAAGASAPTADEAGRRQLTAAYERLSRTYELILHATSEGFFGLDPEGRITYANAAAARMLGWPVEDMLGQPVCTLVHGAGVGHGAGRCSLHTPSATAPSRRRNRFHTRDGARLAVEYSLAPIIADDRYEGAVLVFCDVSEQRRIEAELDLAASVFHNAMDGIVVTDAAGTILSVNPAFTEITGYTAAEACGRNSSLLRSHRHGPDFYRELWSTLLRESRWQGEIWNRRKDGEAYLEWLTISRVADAEGDGKPVRYVGVFSDITELRRKDEHIRHLAFHDPLTGLPNRALLLDRLKHGIERARREKNRAALMFIDLDRFKAVNDSLGHNVGDALLQEVASRLQQCLRQADTVARMGGDEFVLLLDHGGEAEDHASLAQKIIAALSAPMFLGGHSLQIGASIGIACFPDDGGDAIELMKHADAAMYVAKAAGRGTYRFFRTAMTEQVVDRLKLEIELHNAVPNGELELHYQPKVELQHGHVVGAEALLRWHHPARGLVAPDDFIPIAEETGLITPIGEWVIAEACRQLKAWRDEGLPPLALSVNLSASQFHQENLCQVVAEALAANGIPEGQLEMELTESAVMHNPDRAVVVLGQLKAIGVKISLDDFGTGYSSLNYLKRFPIDTLKIDRSFVRDITVDPDDATIAVAVISLAHSLKLRVVAEGVESEAQLGFLRRHRCDEMQGYYFSRPLPAADFARLLRDRPRLVLDQEGGERGERTLLLVDDEPRILSVLQRLLRRDGYRILTAGSAGEALELLAVNEVGVIVSDHRMPFMSGIEFLSRVKEMYPEIIRIVLTGYTDLDSVTDAINRGAIYKFLSKPWQDEVLRDNLREAFVHFEAKRHPPQAPGG